MKNSMCGIASVALVALTTAGGPLAAMGYGDDHEEAGGLHFSHPLINESPSPDTKLRLDYERAELSGHDGAGVKQVARIGAEYAFHRAVSIEVEAPYVTLEPDEGESQSGLGEVELIFKFANFAFEHHGILLGYGLELGLPTGDDDAGIGSDHILELEPFFNLGVKSGPVEIVAGFAVGIPTRLEEEEEVENEFEYGLSVLVFFTDRVMGLLELDAETALNGEDEGHQVVNLGPGIKFAPFAGRGLELGAAVSFPVSKEKEFDHRFLASVLYHF